MCGSILDRRRAVSGDNVVSMPPRPADEAARLPEAAVPASPREESKPARLADEHFAPAAATLRREPDVPFSIFGVDTGAPLRTDDAPDLHGPSFLGLGDSGGSGDYLLDNEESRGGRKFLLVVVLLVVGGLAYLQYRSDMPVTSIWAAVKARATGQPAPTATEKPSPQEPTANGVQPTQPTATKSDNTQAPDNAANPPTPDASAQNAAANPTATPKDQEKAQAPENPPDKTASDSEANAAAAAKTPPKPAPEKPARGKKNGEEMMAKAQRPQSDQDVASEDEEAASRTKPSAARRDQEGDALVTRAQGFLYGKGGGKSCSTAMSLLKQAAGRGNAKADSQLGAMYATGNCAPFDRTEAYRWFSKAAEAEPNNSYLQRSRDMMWREMSPQERHKVLE
jgi:outer membrane biosynthesis protein TonB